MAKKMKPKFDPNKPFTKPSFDPNKPFERKQEIAKQVAPRQEVEVRPDIEVAEEATPYSQELREDIPKAAKAAPFGYGDEIRGLVGAMREYEADPKTASERYGMTPDELGAFKAMHDKSTDTEKEVEFWDSYRKHRDPVRKEIGEARERSPWASIITNIATDLPISIGAGMLSVTAPIAQKVIQSPLMVGGLAGLGESEAEISPGTEDKEWGSAAFDSILGAASSKTLSLVGDIGKAAIGKAPELRARFSGAGGKEFSRVGGLGDPEKAASELNKAGLFNFLKRRDPNYQFSPKKGIFQKTTSGKESLFSRRQRFKDMDLREVSLERINDMIRKSADHVDNILYSAESAGKYTGKDILNETKLKGQMSQYLSDLASGMRDFSQLAPKVREVFNRFVTVTNEPRTLFGLNELKRNIMNEVSESYLEKSTDQIETRMKQLIASSLKDFINDKAEQTLSKKVGSQVGKLNNLMHHGYTLKEPLAKAVASAKGQTDATAPMFGNILYKIQKYSEMAAGGQTGLLARASTGELIENATNFLRLNKRIPRTSNNILDYKNVIYAKLAVNNPTFADLFRRNVVEQDPNTAKAFLKNNARLMAQLGDQAGIFEESPYEEIDGIPSENGAFKYRQDVNDDDSMSVFDKAEEMDRFNRDGKIYNLKQSDNESNIDLMGSIIQQ